MFSSNMQTTVEYAAIPSIIDDALCGEYSDGATAFEQGDYVRAQAEFREVAEEGAAVAQYYLGVMYDNGLGVPRDYGEAVRWYKAATEQGHMDAQFNLGDMYKCGHGVQQWHAEAVRWYRAAADQGDPYAQFSLGIMYQCGEGDLLDIPFAYMWLRLALSLIPPGDDRESVLKACKATAENMTQPEIDEAELLEQEWLETYGSN